MHCIMMKMELHRGRLRGMMSRKMLKVLACPERMHKFGTDGERQSRAELANRDLP